MTVTEQQGAVESLTHIVSSTMGLREQLDVIRILNPKAVVSATDTEFEIGWCSFWNFVRENDDNCLSYCNWL